MGHKTSAHPSPPAIPGSAPGYRLCRIHIWHRCQPIIGEQLDVNSDMDRPTLHL
jgi:hypothetical protein